MQAAIWGLLYSCGLVKLVAIALNQSLRISFVIFYFVHNSNSCIFAVKIKKSYIL